MSPPPPTPGVAPGVALVTGAAKRIGRAIALDLAQLGWAVAVHCHSAVDEGRAVVAEIAAAGGRATLLIADLADEAAVLPLIAQAEAALGCVTVLVNNASIFERDEALSTTRASWDAHLEINLRAPFVLIQEMARRLPANQSGLVINLIDQRVWALTPHFTSYTVSKVGLWALTQTLALALAPRIRVNAIGPGPTLPSPRQSQDQFLRQCAAMPLGHGTSPDEICRTVRFLLDAPALTGQMIALDGGQHLGWAFPSAQAEPED